MIELHPRPDALDGLGLPAIPYPVALPAFKAAVANDGELPLADMLHGLQLRAADSRADWQRMEPAMARLAELLAPEDARESVIAEGEDWWLEIGPIDLGREVVTLQRDDALLAAIAPREDGRLRVAAYRPLDGRTIELLLALSCRPDPQTGAPDQRSSWERARDSAIGAGRQDACGEGVSHLSWWESSHGANGGGLPAWRVQDDLQTRPPACVAAEIGIFHMMGDTAGHGPLTAR